METKVIPTAEEFARGEYDDNRKSDIFMERQIDMKHALWMMNVHAKRHVKAALKAAVKKAKAATTPVGSMIHKDSILNAYPDKLII